MVHKCAEMQMRIYVDSFRDNAMEDMKKDRGSMESSSGASKSGAGARRSGKSKIGLIALDLDGTTLRSDRRVGERTKAALTEAAKRGVHVVIATGRSLHSLPEEVLAVEGIKYAITSNGAKIVRLEDNLFKLYCTGGFAQHCRDSKETAERCGNIHRRSGICGGGQAEKS